MAAPYGRCRCRLQHGARSQHRGRYTWLFTALQKPTPAWGSTPGSCTAFLGRDRWSAGPSLACMPQSTRPYISRWPAHVGQTHKATKGYSWACLQAQLSSSSMLPRGASLLASAPQHQQHHSSCSCAAAQACLPACTPPHHRLHTPHLALLQLHHPIADRGCSTLRPPRERAGRPVAGDRPVSSPGMSRLWQPQLGHACWATGCCQAGTCHCSGSPVHCRVGNMDCPPLWCRPQVPAAVAR